MRSKESNLSDKSFYYDNDLTWMTNLTLITFKRGKVTGSKAENQLSV